MGFPMWAKPHVGTSQISLHNKNITTWLISNLKWLSENFCQTKTVGIWTADSPVFKWSKAVNLSFGPFLKPWSN